MRWVLMAGIAALVFLIPLPYGAVDEWAIFAFELVTLCLWLIYLIFSAPVALLASSRDPSRPHQQARPPSFSGSRLKAESSSEPSRPHQGRAPQARSRMLEENKSQGKIYQSEIISAAGKYGELQSPSRYKLSSRLIFLLIIIFLATSLFQLIPLPASVLRLLSPQKLELVEKAGETIAGQAMATEATASSSPAPGATEINVPGNKKVVLSEEGEITKARIKTKTPAYLALSISPALSRYEFLKYFCYFIFGLLILRVVQGLRDIQTLVLVLLAAGLFQAIYGLAEYLSGTGRIFSYKNIWGQGSAFGTFINRDHYAGFLEMIFSLSLGFLLARSNFFALKKGVSWRQKIVWFGQERLQQAILLAALTVIIGVGLFFSRSRSGVIIFFLVFFLMMLALSIGPREEKKPGFSLVPNGGREKARQAGASKRLLRIVRTVTLAVIFVAIFIGVRPIIERFTLESIWREARPKFYDLTLRLVADYPLFGTGAGTYIYAYTPYEDQDLHGILHHAHNDYLETLAEMGLVGGGAIILAALGSLALLLARWLKLPERDYFGRGVGLGLIGGIVAILLHSISDFNLRVPANAVYFICFYTLAWRLLSDKPKTKRGSDEQGIR